MIQLRTKKVQPRLCLCRSDRTEQFQKARTVPTCNAHARYEPQTQQLVVPNSTDVCLVQWASQRAAADHQRVHHCARCTAADLEDRGFAGPALQQGLQLAGSFSSIGLRLQLLEDPLGTAQADTLLPRLLNAQLQSLDPQSPLCPKGLVVSNGWTCKT